MKKCNVCCVEKPLEDFNKVSRKYGDGFHGVCKPCLFKQHLAKPARVCVKCGETKPPEDFKVRAGNWCKECHNKSSKKTEYSEGRAKYRKNVRRFNQYGITKEEYQVIEKAQENKCAICGVVRGSLELFIDHCHTSFKVRGLLCDKCNRGLGFFNDNREALLKAAEYLKQ